MLIYPDFNPIALKLGPFAIHWYGVMYVIGFLLAYTLLFFRYQKNTVIQSALPDVFFYAALGVIIGGRLGYMIFYAFDDLSQAPLRLFMVWQGGMSFHGGLVGVIIALLCYTVKTRQSFLLWTDVIAPVVPVGLAAGRIGNFINGELWGRITSASFPFATIFPRVDLLPRHPSQIYEFFFEGIILFLFLWFFSAKERPKGMISGYFLLGYAICRFFLEFFREPDPQKGFIAWNWLTEGQALSLPMMLAGSVLLLVAYQSRKNVCNNT